MMTDLTRKYQDRLQQALAQPQHTPGDWYVTGPNIRQTYTGALLFVQGSQFHDYDPDPVEQAANLRLTAAAPNLLTAALLAQSLLREEYSDAHEVLKQLDAAIAKAFLN
jgi:hypothetical protein